MPGRKPSVTEEDIRTVLEDADEPLGTADFADALDTGRQLVRIYLQQFEDEDWIASKKMAGRRVYYYTGDIEEPTPLRHSAGLAVGLVLLGAVVAVAMGYSPLAGVGAVVSVAAGWHQLHVDGLPDVACIE